MRITHGLPCACELSKYVLGSIPLDSIHMFWRRLSFSDQELSEPQVTIKDEIKTLSKRFEELDVCGKVTLKSKLWKIAYPDQNSMFLIYGSTYVSSCITGGCLAGSTDCAGVMNG